MLPFNLWNSGENNTNVNRAKLFNYIKVKRKIMAHKEITSKQVTEK